ncbi:hypothetical protein [Candidatus Ichthyocystis sparus]|uniref:hypothetical protein n=2 Tax=Candidatus Ichthyocystis sparus TaxID=1561004 RepID=UPI000B870BE2|nr:hypothetical protein [Candidatus Ichthyocystis sparus]
MKALHTSINKISKLISSICKKLDNPETTKTLYTFEKNTYKGIFTLILEKIKTQKYIALIESKIFNIELKDGDYTYNYVSNIFTKEILDEIKESSVIYMEELKTALPQKIGRRMSRLSSTENEIILEKYRKIYNNEITSLELNSKFFLEYIEQLLFSDRINKNLKLPNKYADKIYKIQVELFTNMTTFHRKKLYENKFSILTRCFNISEKTYYGICKEELLDIAPNLPNMIMEAINDCQFALNLSGKICALDDSSKGSIVPHIIEEIANEYTSYLTQNNRVTKIAKNNTRM